MIRTTTGILARRLGLYNLTFRPITLILIGYIIGMNHAGILYRELLGGRIR